ncbi:MAG: NAD(P)/FAD-dependent oxidoreductase [Actinobacteria bacterium]|nr:NAD(P)/FAD-dependent oxidoreductase [Actinomycetota bacterium]
MDFNVVVIGAGLGGCAAGAALAGAGKKVLVLERTDKVGGRCSTMEKNGFEMDMGSHMILRTGYGPFREALSRVGKEKEVEFFHIRKMLLKVGDTSIEIGFKTFFVMLQDLFPSSLVGLAVKLLAAVEKPLNRFTANLDKKTIQNFVARYTDSLVWHNLLDWCAFILYGTPYWETPMGELMRTVTGVLAPLVEGIGEGEFMAGYIKGGLIAVPNALCRGIKEHGGEIRTGVDVKRIIVENGRAIGVETDTGEVICSDLILSNAGIRETVSKLVGEQYFNKEYAEYIRALKPGCSGWCLRLALDEPFVEYDLIFNIPEKDTQEYYRKMWIEQEVPEGLPAIMATTPSNMDPTLAPEGKQSLIAIAPVSFDPSENWPLWEQKALDAVEDAIPGISDHIIWHDFLAPGTYLVFGEEKAPAIGIAQCMGQAGKDRPSSISPVEGLYYVGAEAGKNASGVATEVAIQSGLNCADYLLKKKKVSPLLKKIGKGSKMLQKV